MRGLGFVAVMVALSPPYALAQDYTTATNSGGALGGYARSTERGTTYLDRARSRQLAVALGFFGSAGGAEILIFENRGSVAAADCMFRYFARLQTTYGLPH
jgi:hypothetical protein